MASKPLLARPLNPDDKEAWDSLVSASGSVFDSLRWTELFGPGFTRLGIYDAAGNLRGGFCVRELRQFGLRVLRNPPYTPQIGPFYEPRASNAAARTDEQRAVVEAMAEYLTSSGAQLMSIGLSAGITDCLPFRWRGWKVVTHYTYRIDLRRDELSMLSAMSTERRSRIRKAIKDGISLDEASDTEDLRCLVQRSFARQGMRSSDGDMDRLLAGYPPGTNSYCYVARHHGAPVAAVYVVHDTRTAFNLLAGYDDSHSHTGAGPLAMWHAMLKAKEMGLEVFDFEGSVIPPIERYYRGFGGALTPLFTVQRAWLPLEMVLKVARRHLF